MQVHCQAMKVEISHFLISSFPSPLMEGMHWRSNIGIKGNGTHGEEMLQH